MTLQNKIYSWLLSWSIWMSHIKTAKYSIEKALMWSVKYRKLQFCKWQEQELTLKELGQQQQK